MTASKQIAPDAQKVAANITNKVVEMYKHRSVRNWINVPPIKVFLRSSVRVLDGRRLTCIDIGNININSKHQNKGYFTALLDHLERLDDFEAVYVENVIATSTANRIKLNDFLIRKGYSSISNRALHTIYPNKGEFQDLPNSFIKAKNNV